MIIIDTGIGDHFLLVNKKGFLFVMEGVQTHFVVPMRLLMNLAHGEGGVEGMEHFVRMCNKGITQEIPVERLIGKTVRQVWQEFEFRNIMDFYIKLDKEEKGKFQAIFGDPFDFGESPLYAFRNSNGIDFL